MRRLPIVAAGLGLLTFAFMVPVLLGQTPAPLVPAKPALPAVAEVKPALQVKVFRVARAEPSAVHGVLESLLGPMDEVKFDLLPMGGTQPLQGMLGNLGCGFGGLPVGPPLWRAAVNERTKAVIVRGSAKHLAIAADVVAVLDRVPNAPLPKTPSLQAFELKTATASELLEVIDQLAFEDVHVSTADTMNLLLVVAPVADQKTIAELVKNLDGDGKQDGD